MSDMNDMSLGNGFHSPKAEVQSRALAVEFGVDAGWMVPVRSGRVRLVGFEVPIANSRMANCRSAGLVIERGGAAPTGRFATEGEMALLRAVFWEMGPGDSVLWPGCRKLAYDAARQCGIRITTRKTAGGAVRIWRKE